MMDEAHRQSNDYGAQKDRFDSFKSKLEQQRDMYAKQYQNLNDQYELVQQMNPDEVLDQVRFGSVVCTDKGTYMICTGLGKVDCDGQAVFAISMAAPIYNAMEGKKVGNTFSFNGITQKIKAIY